MLRDALLSAGLAALDDGFAVFLLGPSKRPVANCRQCKPPAPPHDPEACGCLLCHGFYSGTHREDRFRDMLDCAPDGMVAIRTGTASGIVVVDIDPGHGGQVDPNLMPATRSVVTGSGGRHLYYWHPGGPVPCSQSVVAPGVDVRADGGYAVAAGSRHPTTGRLYVPGPPYPIAEMPSSLLAACLPKRTPVCSGLRAGTHSVANTEGISNPAALLAANLAAVRRAPEGRRRTTLYGASRGVARIVAAGVITRTDAIHALEDAGRDAGQSARDIARAIEGGFRDEGVAA